ncbi:MAG: hypothetical protein KDA99_04710, partial [Planctomycetales bacterium]|nr:hypothetical protein [Planctomycetales bacterium]
MRRKKGPSWSRRRLRLFEMLEDRRMLVGNWQNPVDRLDVNADGAVSPIDALLGINYLNSDAPRNLPDRVMDQPPYYDVSGDGVVSAIDVLQVINRLSGSRAPLNAAAETDQGSSTSVDTTGFVSMPLIQLPGELAQNVSLQITQLKGAAELRAFGLFVMDGDSGAVGGVMPSEWEYAATVLQSEHNQRFDMGEAENGEPITSEPIIGSSYVGLYLLQSRQPTGSSEDHIRIMQVSPGVYDIAWEENHSVWPGLPRVGDRGFDDALYRVTIGEPVDSHCPFPNDLADWRVTQSGGSLSGQGTVVAENCTAIMTEGDSFVVTLERDFVIPAEPAALSFTFADLNFDTTDPDFINDAFEVALVDEFGNSLIETYSPGRDAFFNISEDVGTATGGSIQVDDGTITVDLNGILAGTPATIVFRLANNDDDSGTSVSIVSATVQGDQLEASNTLPASVTFAPPDISIPTVLKVSSGTIGRTNHVKTASDTFQVSLATSSQQSSSFSEPVVEWSRTQFVERPTSDQVMMTPAVIDVNKDGVPDV